MGDHAQDAIERGMMGSPPFGRYRRGARLHAASTRRAQRKAVITIPETVSDDYMTWWYDAIRSHPENEKMSEYEVVALAWHEVVKRIREANKA